MNLIQRSTLNHVETRVPQSTVKSGGKCKGFVIDHVNPLKRGGADAPSNMQWQSVEAAKAKDRVE